MVEVVGTAPTSAMVITKFVYRHSCKNNGYNIMINLKNDTYFQMKNYFFFTTIFILILILSILVYFNYERLFDLILIVKKLSNDFLIIYLLFIFIYFLTPFPTTLIILLNGFLFEDKGFLISYFIIIINKICNQYQYSFKLLIVFQSP